MCNFCPQTPLPPPPRRHPAPHWPPPLRPHGRPPRLPPLCAARTPSCFPSAPTTAPLARTHARTYDRPPSTRLASPRLPPVFLVVPPPSRPPLSSSSSSSSLSSWLWFSSSPCCRQCLSSFAGSRPVCSQEAIAFVVLPVSYIVPCTVVSTPPLDSPRCLPDSPRCFPVPLPPTSPLAPSLSPPF
ncbi:hypothetical protein DMC30DRAFT_400555 [Rhodotorula diobovata]|uniref:Uncharacterized protein n=1 Tax=Rhodotorula diobovata TaxID=5288 RepID=A0A5C5FRF6_9BASI|nr:hypothetical protein DMC30DRAFT_400555 [Rhodotorula diobovata]